MKLIVSFTYYSVKYRFTINEDDIDKTHYEDLWDYWVGENDNELVHSDNDNNDEDGLVFEITGNKLFVSKDEEPIISGNGIYINVYDNEDADDYTCQITSDIDARCA